MKRSVKVLATIIGIGILNITSTSNLAFNLLSPQITQAMIVYDPENYAANYANKLQLLTMYEKQVEDYTRKFATMDNSASSSNSAQIQQSLNDLASMQEQVEGMTMDFRQTQTNWDANYKDYGEIMGMSGTDYANYSDNLMLQSESAIKNAMRSQGLVANDQTVSSNIRSLLSASQNAQGELSVVQTANQIASIQAQQLMDMKRVIADSARATAVYQEKANNDEKIAKAKTDKFFTIQYAQPDWSDGAVTTIDQ